MKTKLARTLFPWYRLLILLLQIAVKTILKTYIYCRSRPGDQTKSPPSRLPPSLRANRSNRIDDVSAAYINNLFNEWNRAYESRSEK